MPIDMTCSGATPVVVDVATSGVGGSFRWRMRAGPHTPRTILVSANGDLDFSHRPGPIRVTVRLTSSRWSWRGQNTMEFNDEPRRIVRNFVQPGNHQVQLETVDGRNLVFCYANHLYGGAPHGGVRHPTSYYGLWVQNAGQNAYIDPIISNGGRPGAEDPP
jgi:hypothetical protein